MIPSGYSGYNLDDKRVLSFPDDTREIETFVAARQISMMILDPLNAFLADAVRTNTDHSVRRALTPLGKMAERTGLTVIVVRHLTKAPGSNPLLRGQGSIAFIGAVRASLLVAHKDDNEELRYVASNKHSLTATPATQTFVPEYVPALDTVRIAWRGAVADKAQDLLADADDDKQTTIDEYTDAMRDYLEAEGPAEANDVLRGLRKQGLPDWAARHARNRLGVKPKRSGFGKGSRVLWALPDLPRDNQPDGESASIDVIDAIDVTHVGMTSMGSDDIYGGPRPVTQPAARTPDAPPNLCRTCSAPLLLHRPGRDQCERCRLAELRANQAESDGDGDV